MRIKRNEEKICDKQTLREELRANIDSITKDLTQSATVVSLDEYKKNEQEAKEIFDKRSKEVEQAGDGKAEMAEIENDIESIDKKLQDLRSEQEEAARAGRKRQVKIRLKRRNRREEGSFEFHFKFEERSSRGCFPMRAERSGTIAIIRRSEEN